MQPLESLTSDGHKVAQVEVPGLTWSRTRRTYNLHILEALQMPKITTLEDLFVQELKDLLDAENQLTRALPKMAKAATAPELKEAIQEHLAVTKQQVERLTQVFEEIGKPAKGKKCEAMKGLITEGQELMQQDIEPELLDAGLIGAAQKVEHYEMAGYGTVRSMATILGHTEAAALLDQTFKEEQEADKKLTMIAKKYVNVRALKSGQAEESEEELEDAGEVDSEEEGE
jgi:ferritin-like metal-binding protein YciE